MADEGPTTELEVWATKVASHLGMWQKWLENRTNRLNDTIVSLRKTGIDIPEAAKAISTMQMVAQGMEERMKEFKRIEELDGK